ncbi:ferric-rhodotorulic acid/ferric-coprogen receptor FhuE [Brenneria sp. L3-3C-1]|nr:ferric-rhodotorulic acid/ferric-coprogen receptor FhuE [Brenneria sp. L3-3C-1]
MPMYSQTVPVRENRRIDNAAFSGPESKYALSLIAILIASALTAPDVLAADESANVGDTLVVSASPGNDAVDSDTDYSVKTTSAGTGLSLTPRDIPQSVSVITKQRIQDQNLQSIGEVLQNTTGIATQVIDSERTSFYSRGFYINNYQFDGIPTTMTEAWNFGDAGSDTAIYDRIEVVRGATGLLTGAGNPSASVNMVRKHADSREFIGSVSGSYGSWDNQRYVADLSAPLSQSGDVRGRVIAGYQDNDSFLDRYHYRKKFLYGVIDADLSANTTLSLGYDYQQSTPTSVTWGGMPNWYSDGSRTRLDRGFNVAPNWSHHYVDTTKVFANLNHQFDNGWEIRSAATHAETDFDSKLMFIGGLPDKTTGLGTSGYGGWYIGTRKLDAIDTLVRGPFELLGRQHELVSGVSYSRQTNNYRYATVPVVDIGNFNNWNGVTSDLSWPDFADYSDETVHQKALYTAARFSLADPLALIVGARYTDWRSTAKNYWSTPATTSVRNQDNITPYGGLIYDINDVWSTYVSYTEIFMPQDYKDRNGSYLDPIVGKNYETGLKAAWYDGRLTASFSVFRIEQDNVAQPDGSLFVPGTSQQAYYGAQGTVSKGFDVELNGAVTDNLQLTLGGSHYTAVDQDNTAVNSHLPRTQLKLFTRYQLPTLPELTVGGGVNWQSHTYADVTGPQGETRVTQGSYSLVSLFGRYQVTPQFSVQANINNLLDKTYYSYLNSYSVYGAPRSVSVAVNYTF